MLGVSCRIFTKFSCDSALGDGRRVRERGRKEGRKEMENEPCLPLPDKLLLLRVTATRRWRRDVLADTPLGVLPFMTSAKYSDFFLPPLSHFHATSPTELRYYVCFSMTPPHPSSADVINGCFLRLNYGFDENFCVGKTKLQVTSLCRIGSMLRNRYRTPAISRPTSRQPKFLPQCGEVKLFQQFNFPPAAANSGMESSRISGLQTFHYGRTRSGRGGGVGGRGDSQTRKPICMPQKKHSCCGRDKVEGKKFN